MQRSEDQDNVEVEEIDPGCNPTECVGPRGCEASVVDCEITSGELNCGPSGDLCEIIDEVHDSFPVEEIPVIIAADGLPEIVTPDYQTTFAPSLTWDSLICMEDTRKFVEVFRGEELFRDPEEYDSDNTKSDLTLRFLQLVDIISDAIPDVKKFCREELRFDRYLGMRSKYRVSGEKQERKEFLPEQVKKYRGILVVDDPENDCHIIPVRPIRLRCKHYKRQIFINDDNPDPSEPGHTMTFRICSARRSNGGAYMSLSNESVYACDIREPKDPISEGKLDKRDNHILVKKPHEIIVPFNVYEG